MSKFILKATKNDKIFWTKNSVDKPSNLFLQQEIIGNNNANKWVTLGNIAPNYLNQFNATITVDSDDYTYFELVDTTINKSKYFLVEGINKILNNGYVLDITLDVYVTYTLDFMNTYIKDKPILVNRTSNSRLHAYNAKALLSPDPLINTSAWPVVNCHLKYNDNLVSQRIDTSNLTGPTKVAISRLQNQNTEINWWWKQGNNGYIQVYTNNIKLPEGIFCDLYLTDDGCYFAFPLIDASFSQSFFVGGLDSYTFQCRNNEDTLKQIRTNGYWISKYKGRFYLPCWFWILKFGFRWHFIENTIGGLITYSLGFEFETPFLEVAIPRDFIPFIDSKAMDTTFDINPLQDNLPNVYIKSKTCQLENDTPLFFIQTEQQNARTFLPFVIPSTLHGALFRLIIDGVKGFEWHNIDMEQDLGYSFSGFSTLPITTSNYLSYLSTVSSSTAANLSAAKQQMLLGVTQIGMSGANNIISSIGNGLNPLNSIIGTGFGITNKILQYQNQEKAIQASKADKQRSATPNQFLPTNYKDNYANIAALGHIRNTGSPTYFIRTDSITVKTIYLKEGVTDYQEKPGINWIQYYNNLIWNIGYYINDYVVFNDYTRKYNINIQYDIDPFNPFIYWDIEIPEQYVYNYFITTNKELQNAILTTINQPIRIWKETIPDYKAKLYYRPKEF